MEDWNGDSDKNIKGQKGNKTNLSLSAEREGFEPSVPVSQYDSLANCSFRPLRHLSLHFFKDCEGREKNPIAK